MTPEATYQGSYQGEELAWELNDFTVQVVENPMVNRGQADAAKVITALDAAQRASDVLASPSGSLYGTYCPTTTEQGEDGGLLVAQSKFKVLIRAQRTPTPFFPDRQGIKMSDGTVIPMGDGFFSPSGYDINTTLRVLGYNIDDISEIYVFSKLDSTTAYREYLKAAYIDSSCPSIGRDYWSQPFSGSSLEKVVFKGRTLEEVQAMANYPWGLSDTSKIQTI